MEWIFMSCEACEGPSSDEWRTLTTPLLLTGLCKCHALSLHLLILFWACVMQDSAALKLTSVIRRCEGNGTFSKCVTRKPASHSALLCERADRLKGHAASCPLVSRENQSTTFDSGNNTPPEKWRMHSFFPPINVALLAWFASYFFDFVNLNQIVIFTLCVRFISLSLEGRGASRWTAHHKVSVTGEWGDNHGGLTGRMGSNAF